MKKGTVVFGIFLVVLLIVSGIASAATPVSPTWWTSARIVGEALVTTPDGFLAWKEVPGLVDFGGGVRLRFLAEMWPDNFQVAWLDGKVTFTGNGRTVECADNVTTAVSIVEGIPVVLHSRNIDGAVFFELDTADWQLLGLRCYSYIEREEGIWTIHVHVQVNPPPPAGM
jgi:hypothetical protein